MFTGIIESLGKIQTIESVGTNKTFWIASPVSHTLEIDQSVSHNGVCLTVEEIRPPIPAGDPSLTTPVGLTNPASQDVWHRVTAIEETLKKTNLDTWQPGDLVNLERCMVINSRIDGHIVQGHVDATAACLERRELNGSWEYRFEFPKKFSHLVIEKGSISLNGTSLTIFNVKKNRFDIAIIPYTFEHTNIHTVQPGSKVNIEFDMIGKYVSRMIK